jgi:hypothetical protein
MLEILVYGAIWLLAGCVVALGLGGIIRSMETDKTDPMQHRRGTR